MRRRSAAKLLQNLNLKKVIFRFSWEGCIVSHSSKGVPPKIQVHCLEIQQVFVLGTSSDVRENMVSVLHERRTKQSKKSYHSEDFCKMDEN